MEGLQRSGLMAGADVRFCENKKKSGLFLTGIKAKGFALRL